MLLRLLVAVAVPLLAFAAWRLWKRAPNVSRLDLRELGLSGPAIVQFTTPYCAPCKTNAKVLRGFARDAEVPYAQVDLGKRPELARRYGIRTVPTIVVAAGDGRVLGTWTDLPANGEIREAALSAR
ncbi:MAG: thioredoxin family protein [Actinobacteria bacterium]|nr:thioredoxin family protein [Actinomycetota bacterium]